MRRSNAGASAGATNANFILDHIDNISAINANNTTGASSRR